MTFEARVNAIVAKGYSQSQAEFLVLVMLHSGVCTVRQYCDFTHRPRGQKSQDFFAQLVDNDHASSTIGPNGRLRVFHIFGSALYDAIGEPDNRNRRAPSPGAAIERIMLLDAILSTRQLQWLATENEKLSHFTRLFGTALRREDLPHLTFGKPPDTTTRYFPDKLPIGLDGDGPTIFTFLVRGGSPIDFRAFLHRHAELLRAVPNWHLRLLLPRHLVRFQRLYCSVFADELLTPLRLNVVAELLWFFRMKRSASAGDPTHHSERFRAAVMAFDGPRFSVLYRRWLELGDEALRDLSSPVLVDAVARGRAKVESHVLAHPYVRFQSTLGTA